MRLAVLSGKGGTGKTLLSVNLAAAADNATYVDCDVEEPNGHLYFQSDEKQKTPVYRMVPHINPDLCTGCRTCVDFCRFNALAMTGTSVTVFEQVCHSCGGCTEQCPTKAISEEPRLVGEVSDSRVGNIRVLSGELRTKEAFGIPIIKTLFKKLTPEDSFVVVDCPPGSACAVMESIQDADVCLLVAEPTIFGAHNLNMVVNLSRLFKKPIGVVLNKCEARENPSEAYCLANDIPILARIPFDLEIGELHSEAKIAVTADPKYRELFTQILYRVKELVLEGGVQ
jgi:MinD superfamily P-loop ATPase